MIYTYVPHMNKATFHTYGKTKYVRNYLRVWAEGKFSQRTGSGQVNKQEEKRQRFTAGRADKCQLGSDLEYFPTASALWYPSVILQLQISELNLTTELNDLSLM